MDIVVDAPPDRQLLSATVRHAIRPRMRRLRVLGVILVVIGGLLALLGASATGESETIVMGVSFAAMGILINLLLPRRVERLTMRLMDKVPELRQHRRLRITDGGLRSVSPLVDASYAWAAFTGVEEIPGALLLRVGQGFVVVPTRQMSPDQVLQLRMCVASQASHPGRAPAGPWAPAAAGGSGWTPATAAPGGPAAPAVGDTWTPPPQAGPGGFPPAPAPSGVRPAGPEPDPRW